MEITQIKSVALVFQVCKFILNSLLGFCLSFGINLHTLVLISLPVNLLDELSIYEPLDRECIKAGSGIACCTVDHRNAGRMIEAIIVISEISETTSCCFRTCGAKSEVCFTSSVLCYLDLK
jgi:hypothetical protein